MSYTASYASLVPSQLRKTNSDKIGFRKCCESGIIGTITTLTSLARKKSIWYRMSVRFLSTCSPSFQIFLAKAFQIPPLTYVCQILDHCVDLLRQTAMCHADASLTTFVWHPAKQRPMFNASESAHKCIDWSILMASIADRVVNEQEILQLENPLMQPQHGS